MAQVFDIQETLFLISLKAMKFDAERILQKAEKETLSEEDTKKLLNFMNASTKIKESKVSDKLNTASMSSEDIDKRLAELGYTKKDSE